MIDPRLSALRVAAVLVLQFLWVGMSHAQNSANGMLNEEFSKQAAIYQSRGEDIPEGYFIDRSLLTYTLSLASDFSRSLVDLGPADRWLDIGAGEGRAILDYATARYDAMYFQGRQRNSKKARAVAISIEDRRTNRWHRTVAGLEENQIRYLSGRRLGQYSLEELGQFRVITDVLGGFSYTENLSRFTEKALALLEVNGSFYTLLQDVRADNGTNRPFYPDSSFLTEITDDDGSEVRVCSWLKKIGCVQVSCELKAESSPPIEVYRIHKVCNNVTVPALSTVHFEAGTPPERRFRLSNPASSRTVNGR